MEGSEDSAAEDALKRQPGAAGDGSDGQSGAAGDGPDGRPGAAAGATRRNGCAQATRRGERGPAAKRGGRAQDRRVARTKAAVHAAVLKLVQERAFDKVTVAAVAREADIDRKTFYLHYASVDDVVDEIVREEAEWRVAIVREEAFALGERMDVADLFSRVSVALMEQFEASGLTFAHLSSDLLLRKIERPLTEAIIADDALGMAAALGPRLPYAVSFFSAGLLSVMRHWLADDSEMPLEELARMASVAVASGVEGLLRDAQRAV